MRDFRAEGFKPWPVPGRAYEADCYPPKGALLIIAGNYMTEDVRLPTEYALAVMAWRRQRPEWWHEDAKFYWKLTGIAREEMGLE